MKKMKKSLFNTSALTAVALFLTACGGGGGGGGGGSGVAAGAGGAGISGVTVATSEFNRSSFLSAVKAEEALKLADSNGDQITGKGVMVAVVDAFLPYTGGDTNFQTVAGVNVDTSAHDGRIFQTSTTAGNPSGANSVTSHGTQVSSIIAAGKDDDQIHGVAYNSRLLQINIVNGVGIADSDLQEALDIANGTNTDGAIGSSVTADIINMSLEGSLGASVQAALNRSATAGSIVVAAAGNNGQANPSGIAQHASDGAMNGQMIVVGNVFDPNGDGNFSDATLFPTSNRAGVTQNFYLVAPGTALPALNTDGTDASVTGTSFAAPVVSGAAALVKQAAPHLTAAQVVNILLTTADDLGAAGVDAVFGHGMLNLQSAMQPIGPLALATSVTVAGSSVSLANSSLTLSSSFGDGLKTALSNTDTGVFDDFGRFFAVNLSNHVSIADQENKLDAFFDQGKTGSSIARDFDNLRKNVPDAGFVSVGGDAINGTSFAFVDEQRMIEVTERQTAFSAFSSMHADVMGIESNFESFFISGQDSVVPGAGFMGDGYSFNHISGLNESTNFSQSAFISDHSQSVNAALSWKIKPDFKIGFGVNWLNESAAMGSSGDEGLTMGDGSTSSFATLSSSWSINENFQLNGAASIGSTRFGAINDSVIKTIDNVTSSAWSVAATAHVDQNNIFGLKLSQPLRVEGGTANLQFATGRDISGNVIYNNQVASLAPSGRQIDLELGWEHNFSAMANEKISGSGANLKIFAMGTHEPGHIAENDNIITTGFKLSFGW